MAYQLKDKKYEGNYNIGPDKKSCLHTKDLVEKFYKAWKNTGCSINSTGRPASRTGRPLGDEYTPKVIYGKVKNAKHEAAFLRLDNSLIKKVFGYKEIYDMNTTMRYTADVYRLILKKEPILPYIINILK